MNNTKDKIIVKGAMEHNLKAVDLELDKNELIVFSGISGSGKSSLAFDTIYTEGQRRYVESLSNYTKQFLGVMKKPVVDSIEGLSPAISIEQKTSSSSPRSTVGTVTEIFDFVRMLFARIGKQYCYQCGQIVDSQSLDEIVGNITNSLNQGDKFLVIAPYVKNQRGDLKTAIDFLKTSGFHRIVLDGEEKTFDEDIEIDKNKKHNLDVVVDRLKMDLAKKSRLADSIETALNLAEGNLVIRNLSQNQDKFYSEKNYCQTCDISLPDLSPNSFSFNTPAGMCSKCHGLGVLKEVDIKKLVKYPHKTLKEGAIPYISYNRRLYRNIVSMLKILEIDPNLAFEEYDQDVKEAIFYGIESPKKYRQGKYKFAIRNKYEGLINTLNRLYIETKSTGARNYYDSLMYEKTCDECRGNRLRKESLSVKVHDKNITSITSLNIDKLLDFIEELPSYLSEKDQYISKELRKEMIERLSFLDNVGLRYLTLDRPARTLSGGEAQRIRLASQIGSGLTGVIYVLDEPSIGLHQKDNQRLIDNLVKLRDKGNTVIVVEHDRDTIEKADRVVDFGPEAGIFGGEVIYSGSFAGLKKIKSHTADYIFRKKNVTIAPSQKEAKSYLKLEGVTTNNLKNITAKFPLEQISIVSGVSGAGKSSLVMDTLYPALKNISENFKDQSQSENEAACKYKSLKIIKNNKTISDFKPRLIKIDQSPIGKTPRSNPVTYVGVFDSIREVMAQTKLARMRGYTKGRFSFNIKGGRCEKCGGSGVIKIEMHFLADVFVECDVCKGKRYNAETLEVQFKDKNINEILNMDVQEAYEFFQNIPKIKSKLETLMEVGMGYVKLGQPSNTLSGGEAQRIKLAKELSRTKKEGTIYILDEPTTGLHFYDIQHLLNVLEKLRDQGSTIILIEHNMDMIVNADYLIDLGPEGGPKGGEIIYQGKMKDIVKEERSYTGMEVKKELESRE